MKLLLQLVVLGALWWSLSARGLEEDLKEKTRIEDDGDDEGDDKSTPLWLYFLIPIISGAVGYVTNVMALKMAFYPIEFVGWKLWKPEGQPLGLFGWQGIVPSKAKMMAGKLLDLFLERLIDVDEIFGRVDPHVIAYHLRESTRATVRNATGRLMKLVTPTVWDSLPEYVREEVISVAEKESEAFFKLIMAKIRSNILNIVDLKEYAQRRAVEHKEVMVGVFTKIGAGEIVFIERSGFIFGLLFGIVQAVVYYFYDAPWVLPVAGLFVGFITNLIAMKAIFEPAEKKQIGCYTLQGLFVKRQWEASHEIAEIAQKEFLRAEYVVDEMVNGKKKEAFRALVRMASEDYIDQVYSGFEKIAYALVLGEDSQKRMRNLVVETVLDHIAVVFPAAYELMDDSMNVAETLRERLRAMSPTDFIGTLRPAFQEDEMLLIIVGGILGGIVGLLQQYTLFYFL